jgi:hypothetical protein
MSLFSILFLYLIHLFGLRVFQYVLKIHPSFPIILCIILFILALCFNIYAHIYDPIFPGSWIRKKTDYLKPLFIEISFSGTAKLFYLIFNIFIFSLLLYLVSRYTYSLYFQIFNGTYDVNNRSGSTFVFAPIILAILILLYGIIKIMEKLRILKKIDK